jgi:antitoxin HigA-1
MLPTHRVSTHPGKILLEEFLEPLGMSQTAFAKHIGVTAQRVNQLVNAKRAVSADTAWRLSAALGTTPEFWLNLQMSHDLTKARPKRKLDIKPLIHVPEDIEAALSGQQRQDSAEGREAVAV